MFGGGGGGGGGGCGFADGRTRKHVVGLLSAPHDANFLLISDVITTREEKKLQEGARCVDALMPLWVDGGRWADEPDGDGD